MLQLIYMSTAQELTAPATMAALCEQAARNNARDELTGVLMVHGSTFLQVLEGPREAVEDTFLRIMVDPRHHTLLLLRRKLTTRREYGEWSMTIPDARDEEHELIERVRSSMGHAPAQLRRRFDQHFGSAQTGEADAIEDRRHVSSR